MNEWNELSLKCLRQAKDSIVGTVTGSWKTIHSAPYSEVGASTQMRQVTWPRVHSWLGWNSCHTHVCHVCWKLNFKSSVRGPAAASTMFFGLGFMTQGQVLAEVMYRAASPKLRSCQKIKLEKEKGWWPPVWKIAFVCNWRARTCA